MRHLLMTYRCFGNCGRALNCRLDESTWRALGAKGKNTHIRRHAVTKSISDTGLFFFGTMFCLIREMRHLLPTYCCFGNRGRASPCPHMVLRLRFLGAASSASSPNRHETMREKKPHIPTYASRLCWLIWLLLASILAPPKTKVTSSVGLLHPCWR